MPFSPTLSDLSTLLDLRRHSMGLYSYGRATELHYRSMELLKRFAASCPVEPSHPALQEMEHLIRTETAEKRQKETLESWDPPR
jgi:hypothetical protein